MLVGRELRPFLLEVKVAAVVIETDDIDILQILPCPIVACEFTEMRILGGDVLPLIIWLVARDEIVQCCPCLNG